MEPPVITEPKKRKPRSTPLERAFVALGKDLMTKTTQRMEEAHQHLRGVHVTRTEFVCWLLDKALDKLGKEDFEDFKTRFQDEEGRLKWAAIELKRRREAGETPTLEDILKGEPSKSTPEKRPRRKKPDESQISQFKNQGEQSEKNIESESLFHNVITEAMPPPDNGEI
jgi:hypothetical protein